MSSQKLEIIRETIFYLIKLIAGAILGVIFFCILFYLANSVLKEKYLGITLLSYGMLGTILLGSFLDLSSKMYTYLLFSISAIPYAIVGSLLFSKNNFVRISSIIFLVINFWFSFFLGTLLMAMFSD